MNAAELRFMKQMKTLKRLSIPNGYRTFAWLLMVVTVIIAAALWYTPWVQTAQGTGEVSTLDPRDRTQAISALVAGQIKHWHVREGQQVKLGDPIVTLIDTDKALVERLSSQLTAIQQRHQANLAAVRHAESNLQRQRSLLAEGLVSQRDVEMVEIRLQDLLAKSSSTEAEISKLKVSLARQSIQTKVAPQDGTIIRLLSAGNATFVKPGDILAQFIPHEAKRSVVIKVSGLDAPLVTPGKKVRLQFEGWPVFQFSGWPGTAVGTFGGQVEFVEPVADENGRFNVWIKQDTSDAPWPEASFVRLGSKVKGWVLLGEVKLGYEMWRQLNNFPPNARSEASHGR